MIPLETLANRFPPRKRAKSLGCAPHLRDALGLDEQSAQSSCIQNLYLQGVSDITHSVSEDLFRILAAQPVIDPTQNADRTPIPGSNKRPSALQRPSEPVGMGGGGGGGGNGGRGGPPESDEELELLEVSQDIHDALAELETRGLKIDLIELVNDFQKKSKTRRDILSTGRRFGLRAIQQESKKLKDLADRAQDLQYTSQLSKELYDLEAGEYRSYGESLENFRRMLGFETILELLYYKDKNGSFIPQKWVDAGGGNCNILRLLQVELEKTLPLMTNATEAHATGKKRKSGTTLARSLVEAATEIVKNGAAPRLSDVHTALDIASQSMLKARRKGLNGIAVDLCSTQEAFLQTLLNPPFDEGSTTPEPQALVPNQTSIIHTSLTPDRVPNIGDFFDNLKLLGKLNPDEPTTLIIGTILPLSPISDNETHSPNVPRFHFWNPDAQNGDPRKMMMEDRTESIVNFVWYLNSIGIPVERIAENPSHETVNLHCIVEDAQTLRKEYPELQKKQFVDPELNTLVRNIFAPEGDPCRSPDDEVLCIPQEYRMVYFICKIAKPLDASMVLSSEDDTISESA